jgi:hypothetical protein
LKKPEINNATEGLLKFNEIIPHECVQTTLHIMLAGFKIGKYAIYVESTLALFKRLKHDLVPYHQDYYIAIIAERMATIHKEAIIDNRHQCHRIFTQVRQYMLK